MLAPNAISFGEAFRRSAQVCRACVECGVSLFAGRVGPMGVRVVMIEVVGHRFDYLPRHLRTARAIEVGNRKLIVNPLERGEA